ncbi:hypothetical protein NSP_26450 [Nodularia spumigena CCY9414]|nr:hypothetical protein NSP_26450 [Nodularia spumigena CCY9414]
MKTRIGKRLLCDRIALGDRTIKRNFIAWNNAFAPHARHILV